MLNKTVYGLLFTGLLLVGLHSCSYENVADLPVIEVCDPNATVSFATDIVPIMSGSCASADPGCHGAGNFNNADLFDYAGVKMQADNGKLVSSVTWDGVATDSRMPSNTSTMIDSCSIGKIKRWVADGAPNN
jgi:hypothetical protein